MRAIATTGDMFHDHIREGNIAWLRENTEDHYEPLALHTLGESTALDEEMRITIAELLLARNCTSRNVQREEDGNTALHVAAEKARKKFVDFLLRVGSDRNLRNNRNQTCSDVALTPAIKKLIKNINAVPTARLDCSTVTPTDATVLMTNMRILCSRNKLLKEEQLILLTRIRPKWRRGLAKVHRDLLSKARHALKDAEEFLRGLVEENQVSEHHAMLLSTIILSMHNHKLTLAKSNLQHYTDCLQHSSNSQPQESLDPAFFFAKYCLIKCSLSGKKQVFVSKRERAAAVDCLEVLKLFPDDACLWMTSKDEIEHTIAELGGVKVYDSADGDDSGDDDVNEVVDEAFLRWQEIKRDFQQQGETDADTPSASMDKLMEMIGLSTIKEKCLSIYDTICLLKEDESLGHDERPDRNTVMNFLFTGNPGVGKTTVAGHVAGIMSDLKFRNGKSYSTTANDILKLSKPAEDFSQNVANAEGGVIFIDEVYNFKPSKSGGLNDSNKVLNHLMDVAEKMRATTTFILGGYQEDVEELLSYNAGFPSRFPRELTFAFDDFNEQQLCRIFLSEVKARKFVLQSQQACGTHIALAASRQIGRGIGQKGFGNARTVRFYVDSAVNRQLKRIIAEGSQANRASKNMLTKGDVLGSRPDFSACPAFQELQAMTGLASVKEAIRSLIDFQLNNFDREMRGEKREPIKLFKVFLGNPGTGKTRVARLYGQMLKSLGFLSDGDIIEVKAAELLGSAIQVTGTNVKDLLARAKGKVLFIDEAYGWDPGPSGESTVGNFKLEAIEALMSLPEHLGGDMAIFLAGYKDKMDELFQNSNPGLRSRFDYQNAIVFDDYSDEELLTILSKMLDDENLAMAEHDCRGVIEIISKQRKQMTFGNAREVENAIGAAKVKKAARITQDRRANPNLFKLADFMPQEVDDSLDVFDDLEDIPEVTSFIQKLKNVVLNAKYKIKGCPTISEAIQDMHFLFLGPPGTGKTTVAKRMGNLFKNAGVLPTNNCTVVDSSTLMGAHVGSSAPKVLQAMRQAVGGVLVIDEAYDLQPLKGNYGKDVLETLVQNILKDEFRGKLIIIMAGYEDKMVDFLNNCGNIGFVRRFAKERIMFRPWSAEKATTALIKKIKKDEIGITPEAEMEILKGFQVLSTLPFWASAADVFDIIPKKLELLGSAGVTRKLQEGVDPSEIQMEYSQEDIHTVMSSICAERQPQQSIANPSRSSETDAHTYADPVVHKAPVVKADVKINCTSNPLPSEDENEEEDSNGHSGDAMEVQWFQLSEQEQECEDERITLQETAAVKALKKEIVLLREAEGDKQVAAETARLAAEAAVVEEQRLLAEAAASDEQSRLEAEAALLLAQEASRQAEALRVCTAEEHRLQRERLTGLEQQLHEAEMLAKVRQIGVCMAGYAWKKVAGGYQCGGGTHFVSEDDPQLYA